MASTEGTKPTARHHVCYVAAVLLNPTTSIVIQKRHPYTEGLNSEMPGISKSASLHCESIKA